MTMTRDHARLMATGAMGFACAYLGFVGMFDRLDYVPASTLPLPGLLVESPVWPVSFVGVAAVVGVSLVAGRWHRQAMQLVFALMGPWALFNLAWGLTASRPVSLAGPGLAIVVAIVAQALALTWVTESLDARKKGR